MSAAVLREASQLMRSHAEAASDQSGDWWGRSPMIAALDSTFSPPNAEADAEHIASWHPVVALAVADWLDAMHDRFVAESLYEFPGSCMPYEAAALAVARAYLGRTA